MKCSRCGNDVPKESRECDVCGEPVNKIEPVPFEAPEESPAAQGLAEDSLDEDPDLDFDDLEFDAGQPFEESQPQRVVETEALPVTPEQEIEAEEAGHEKKSGAAHVHREALYQERFNKLVRPVRTGGFFFTEFLLLIPGLNLILLFVWAFRKRTNLNRKAFARSILVWLLILLLLALAGLITLIVLQIPTDYHYWMARFKEFVSNLPG